MTEPDRTVTLYGITAEVPESELFQWDDGFSCWVLNNASWTVLKTDMPSDVHLFACAAEHEWFSKYSPICKPEDWDRETRTHEQAEAWHRIAEAAKAAMDPTKEMEKP